MGFPFQTTRNGVSGPSRLTQQHSANRAPTAPPVYKPGSAINGIEPGVPAAPARPVMWPAQAAQGPAGRGAFPGAKPNPVPGIQAKPGIGSRMPAVSARVNAVQPLNTQRTVTAPPPAARPVVPRYSNAAQADFAPGFKYRPGGYPAARAGAPSAAQQKPAASCGALQPKLPPGVEAFQVNLQQRPGGWSLPKEVQGKMEEALGADFSDVRIHVGPEVSAIGAIAFTWGSNIHFAPGYYSPHTPHGQQLLAHEMTHVVQQRAGRVRNPYGNGVAVVQDAALEAEADRLGQRVALHAKMLGGALQPKVPSSAPVGANQPADPRPGAPGSAQRQIARSDARILQAKGGKLLRKLAQPQTFPGPEVDVQKSIVEELDDLVDKEIGTSLAVFCIGGIELPEELPRDKEALIANVDLVEVNRPAVASRYRFIKDKEDLKKRIVRNTISTMITAGQIDYLRESGLTRECKILVEIHYYIDRPQGQVGFHKDTLGQTLFVNLNYVTEHEIAGPEYIVNPPPVAAHDSNTQHSLPPTFRRHIVKARQRLPEPTEIGASTIPQNGVVAFVDELIHHATPLLGHRKISAADLAAFLEEKFQNEYAKAVAAYDAYQKTSYAWGTAATIGSWLGSWVSTPINESRKWYQWIHMTKQARDTYDRTELAKSGLSKQHIDELLAKYDPGSGDSKGRFPFERVSIPKVGTTLIRGDDRPRLVRRMSSNALNKTLPKQVTGKRRFFRTWVRAVPR